MRAVKMLFTGSLAMVTVAVFACGGSSQSTSGGPDSGTLDGTTPVADSATDSSPGAGDANLDAGAVACTIDADLITLAPPDAALSDAASVGTCIGCARAHCSAEIVNCNSDCTCNNVFDCLFSCLGTVGGTLIYCYTGQCGGELPLGNTTGDDVPEINLIECAAKSCAAACDACSLYPALCSTPDAGSPTDATSPTDGETSGDSAADASDATGE
jgi:hypothetical protein